MSNITYRKSIREDIPSINDLFIEMVKTVNARMERGGVNPYTDFEQGFEPGYLDNFYINDDRLIYVAEDEGKVIGFLSVINKKNLQTIYLDDYCVNDSYRGQGIGSQLMNMSFEFAKNQGYDQVITHVESANTESIEFYLKKGFKIVQEQGHRLLIRRVDNHLSEEKQNELKENNNKILSKILDKIKKEYADKVDIVAIGGSFCSGLYREKSDFDAVIIANDEVDDLSKCFILHGIGQDIYYSFWDRFEHMAEYEDMFSTKLKNLDIVYYRNEEVLNKYKQLQDRLDKNMNDSEKNEKTIDKYLDSIISKKNSINKLENLNDLYKLVGSLMNDIENTLFINNKLYLFGGTKNILTEIYFMANIPDNFINEYEKILDLNNISDIKNWTNSIVSLLLNYFNKEDNNEVMYEVKDNKAIKEDISRNALVGTYEELYSNYYNKLLNAAKTNNKYLSFRTMIDAQGFFDEFTNQFNLPKFNLLEKYNPNNLMDNINAFMVLLSKWKTLYNQFQIDVEEYSSIEELYINDLNKKIKSQI